MSSTKPHIAHIMPWPTVGGTEHGGLRIAKLMSDEFESTAFCPEGPVVELFQQHGFESAIYRQVPPSYRHPTDYVRNSLELAKEFRRRKIDLIHCADVLSAYYAGLAAKITRLPVLSHVRCRYPDISRRDQTFLRAVNRFAFVSRDAQACFAYRAGVKRGSVVYDAVDVDAKQLSSDGPSVRSEFNISPSDTIVGMVSRVAPAKDYETLVKSAKNIVATTPNVKFLIVGDHSQVPMNREHYNHIRKMIADHGLNQQFLFTDHREDVNRLLKAMDIFVLSTKTEGLPLVLLEAMARSKPVVATNVGGVPELIEHGVTGFLHELQDVSGQSDYLQRLISNEGLRSEIGERGRRFVAANFTPAKMANDLRNLYDTMLGRRMKGETTNSFQPTVKTDTSLSV